MNKNLNDYLRPLSLSKDEFFSVAANNDLELAKVIIKPVLNQLGIKDYIVNSARTQVVTNNFRNHDVILDLEVITEDGTYFNVEIQNQRTNDFRKRIRYYRSSKDVEYLRSGESYNKLPKRIIFVISDQDLLKNNRSVSIYETREINTHESLELDEYYIFANNKIYDPNYDDFYNLINDIYETDVDKIKNPVIKDVHKFYKETQIGMFRFSEGIQELFDLQYSEKLKIEVDERTKERTERITQELTQDLTQKITEELTTKITQDLTQKITQDLTQKITQDLTQKITQELTEEFRNIIEKNQKENQKIVETLQIENKSLKDSNLKYRQEIEELKQKLGETQENNE